MPLRFWFCSFRKRFGMTLQSIECLVGVVMQDARWKFVVCAWSSKLSPKVGGSGK